MKPSWDVEWAPFGAWTHMHTCYAYDEAEAEADKLHQTHPRIPVRVVSVCYYRCVTTDNDNAH